MRHWTLPRHLAILLVAAAVMLGVTAGLDPFRDYQLATAAAYLCAAAGLTMLAGQNGQLSLGHGALMAIGGYTVAMVQNKFGAHNVLTQWALLASLAAGVCVAAVAGAVIGVAAARLRGPYLAGLTLVVAVAVPSIGSLWNGLFHGDQGLSVYLVPAPAALGESFPLERWQAWLALIAALVTMLVLGNLTSGQFGRTLRAVRDDEIAARLGGINVAKVQVIAFVVSAACAGLGGGMLAVLAQSVSPGAFAFTLSLNLLLAVVVGGLGSLTGAVWGSILLVLLPWLADTATSSLIHSPAAQQRLAGNLPLAVFGLLLVVVMIAAPGGIQGLLNRAARWVRGRRDGRGAHRAEPSAPDAEPHAPVASRT
ncbi:branched-chain amino acid ABC transporter permease [Rugosimonospora acidiphila]|uniref:Branched-chain amino acid ABC transporter permease n=1 Tax=Rugosimonospora acidiphila TaxID=556531 RepID=A0ABP9RLR5_9ACTN